MNGFLLDTSICVCILRKDRKVIDKIRQVEQSKLYISDVTIAELKVGASTSMNLVLVTDNEKHMARVKDVVTENWRR